MPGKSTCAKSSAPERISRLAGLRPQTGCKLLTSVASNRKMPRLFAFLRAINAGPMRVVRMNVLRKAFESLGLTRVTTFLGSGNIVFETRARDLRALELKIERALREALGYNVPVFIRTHAELKESHLERA